MPWGVAAAAVVGAVASNRAAGRAADAQQASGDAAIDEQRRASAEGLGFLEPFSALGQRGIELSGFLGDPNAQFDFLQNHPLFNLALDNANQSTLSSSAAGGRLASGDTLQQLSNNVLLSASPLIDRQRQDIGNLLNIGTGIAQSQANTAIGTGSNVSNLLTDVGAARAGGIIGQNNANQQGLSGILEAAILSGQIGGGK